MLTSQEDIEITYFVLCDQVITEAQSGKQSLIGIYSALITQQFPFHVNMSVATGLHFTSDTSHNISFRILSPEGTPLFPAANLPVDWNSVGANLKNSPFASMQLNLNLQMLPLAKPGRYTAELLCDEKVLQQYALMVLHVQPANAPAAQITGGQQNGPH